MAKSKQLRYRGDGLPPDGDESRSIPYLADKRLVDAVNMAIFLERPLLLKGPPGCGKTELAQAVAHELGLAFEAWYVKSTSKARDGLYTVDVLRRLQEAQLPGSKPKPLQEYVRFHELGRAIKADRGRTVVLIDEIDKADIDFPNDLLRELDKLAFEIVELPLEEATEDFPREYGAPENQRPIILITSNDEKELPDAFLRRCLFHWIDFPDDERLGEIVALHLGDVRPGLLEAALAKLGEVRGLVGLRKKPATSEFLDWLRILEKWGVKSKELDVAVAKLPGAEALYKHQGDLLKARRAGGEAEDGSSKG